MNLTVDEAIERVEQLYSTVTGTQPPPVQGASVALPPEQDVGTHVEERLGHLLSTMEHLVPNPAACTPTWMPHAIIVRAEAALEIAIDLPGVTADQLQILVEDRVLTVLGRRDAPTSTTAGRRVESCEVSFGRFMRSFQLAAPVAREDVVARLAGGVLTIRITSNPRGAASQKQVSL